MTYEDRIYQLDCALSLIRNVVALANLDHVDADRLRQARANIEAVTADLTNEDNAANDSRA